MPPVPTDRRILVTDAEQRAALAIVRSLGLAGHHVEVASARSRPLAGASRFARATHRLPDPMADPGGFTAAVADRVAARDIDVLVPVAEPSLLALLPARDRFPGVLLPFADARTFAAVSDKRAVAEAAERVGIRVPRQVVLDDPERAPDRVASADYPVVLKPHRSVVGEAGDRVKVGVRYADGPDELRRALAGLPAAAFPVMAQQRIVGPGTGVFLLLWDGEVRAAFAHRRLREKPPSGGVSVYRESVAAPPELVNRSAALLRGFDWRGVAMVEYKVDEGTGDPYLMEINGRFWGSLQLAVDAGVDFPGLLLRAAAGTLTGPPPEYRLGVRSRWLWGDVDHLWGRLKPGGGADLPPGAPGRFRTALEVALPWRPGDRTEVLRLGDPGPFLRETIQWATRR